MDGGANGDKVGSRSNSHRFTHSRVTLVCVPVPSGLVENCDENVMTINITYGPFGNNVQASKR